MKKSILAGILVLCMMGTAAAETISFSGTVEPKETAQVYAPVGGVVEEVNVRAGESVTADTVIARIKTTKVYAAEDGTITAVYGQPGDDAEDVAASYGAVMYLEGVNRYTVSASTSRAYEAKENYMIHSGEEVYLVSRNHTTNKGKGIVTAVDGTSYTVLVTEGDFYVGDSITVNRTSDYATTGTIGRGTLSRISPTAVTGTGSIVSYAVQAGDTVRRGQLLFETVEGAFDGLEMTGTEIKAGTDGVIASLSVEEGGSIAKDGLAAQIYPKNAVWVSAEVTETDLPQIAVGQQVKVELDWNQDSGVSYDGTVEMISSLGTVGEESTTFPVYISFTPDENTRFSMTALVTTLEKSAEPETRETGAEPEETEEPEETGNTGEHRKERP